MMAANNKIRCEQCHETIDSWDSQCPRCATPIRTIEFSETIPERPRGGLPLLSDPTGHMLIDLAAHQIALYIEDASIPLVVDLSNRVTLGRHSSRDNKVSPTVSLNSYNAFNHGISRVHATLYYDAARATAVVVDEYSTNGTWLNGQRIAPMMPTPLENKDELRLSRLRILIITPNQAKRS